MIEIRLRALLAKHQITQTALADAAGVRRAAVSALCRGARRRVDLDQLGRLLTGLQTLTGVRYEPADVLVLVDQGKDLFPQDQGEK